MSSTRYGGPPVPPPVSANLPGFMWDGAIVNLNNPHAMQNNEMQQQYPSVSVSQPSPRASVLAFPPHLARYQSAQKKCEKGLSWRPTLAPWHPRRTPHLRTIQHTNV